MVPELLEPGAGHVTHWHGHGRQSVSWIEADRLCVSSVLILGIQKSSLLRF